VASIERDQCAEEEARHHCQHRKGGRANDRLAQVGQGEQLLVLGQADKIGRAPKEVGAVEAQVDGADERIEDPDREEQQGRRDKGERCHNLSGAVARPAGGSDASLNPREPTADCGLQLLAGP
jgi:hypothetical protein